MVGSLFSAVIFHGVLTGIIETRTSRSLASPKPRPEAGIRGLRRDPTQGRVAEEEAVGIALCHGRGDLEDSGGRHADLGLLLSCSFCQYFASNGTNVSLPRQMRHGVVLLERSRVKTRPIAFSCQRPSGDIRLQLQRLRVVVTDPQLRSGRVEVPPLRQLLRERTRRHASSSSRGARRGYPRCVARSRMFGRGLRDVERPVVALERSREHRTRRPSIVSV